MQNFNLVDNCGGLRAFCRTSKERVLQIPEFLQTIAALGEFALRKLDLVQVVARLVFWHQRPPPAKISGRICLIGRCKSEALIYRKRMPAPKPPFDALLVTSLPLHCNREGGHCAGRNLVARADFCN